MARVLRHSVVVHTSRTEFKTLPAGSVVPKEFADQVTNPKAYVDGPQEPATAPSEPAGSTGAGQEEETDTADYSKMLKPALEALSAERGLALGTAPAMRTALIEADAAAKAAAAASSAEGEVDLSTLDEAGLRALAVERDIDISEVTSEEEIRALIENAE